MRDISYSVLLNPPHHVWSSLSVCPSLFLLSYLDFHFALIQNKIYFADPLKHMIQLSYNQVKAELLSGHYEQAE